VESGPNKQPQNIWDTGHNRQVARRKGSNPLLSGPVRNIGRREPPVDISSSSVFSQSLTPLIKGSKMKQGLTLLAHSPRPEKKTTLSRDPINAKQVLTGN